MTLSLEGLNDGLMPPFAATTMHSEAEDVPDPGAREWSASPSTSRVVLT
jgi:hypothetical protein